jgi:hypothetical protein
VRYQFSSCTVASEMPLTELIPDSSIERKRPNPIAIERIGSPIDPRKVDWFREWNLPNGAPWLAVGRIDGGSYFLRVIHRADFLVDADASRIRIFARPGISDVTLRHLLLDQVLPLLLSHRGELVLHASAVRLPRGAVVMLAAAGSGKSTLAAALGRRGARVLGDDAVALATNAKAVVARAAYPGLRLWPDTMTALFKNSRRTSPSVAQYSRKRRLGPGADGLVFQPGAARVATIYQLDPGRRSVRIEPLASREAVMTLLRHAYVLDAADRRRLQRQLDRAISCGQLAPIRRLAFPHDLRRLDKVCDAVLNDV